MRKKIVIFDIDYTLFNTDAFKQSNLTLHTLYSEVVSTLSSLQTIASLGILSEGDIELQNKKLTKTNIAHFFLKDHVHITLDKSLSLESFLKKYKDYNLFLVDDRLSILFEAKQKRPDLFTVWVKRGRYAKNQKPIDDFTPDATVSDLTKLTSIVSSFKAS